MELIIRPTGKIIPWTILTGLWIIMPLNASNSIMELFMVLNIFFDVLLSNGMTILCDVALFLLQ